MLVVCGSYVPQTTRQLARLRDAYPEAVLEADVGALVDGDHEAEARRLSRLTSELLDRIGLAVVATPRERPGTALSLEAGDRVAAGLAGVVTGVVPHPDVIVAKGGITSAVTLRDGVGAAEAEVVGPVEPGVSRWSARWPGGRAARLRRRAGQRRRRRAPRAAGRGDRARIARVLSGFRDVLDERRAAGAAAGSFTCYDVTTACGVVHAAEAAGVPVVLLVSEASVASRDGRLLLPALGAIARSARVPVCVQLDHANSLELIREALASGAVGAVLADGSRLPYGDNVAFVSAARDLARSHGAEIEVELGHVEGGEDVAAATAAGKLTDPAEAAEFVAATEASCLAVSIGNVHGTYAAEPALDWARLDAIRAAVDVPLSLHGASGLPEDDVRRAVAAGVAKVNVNTEVRERTFAMLDSRLDELSRGWRIAELDAAIVAAVEEVVSEKLELLGGRER